MLMPRDLPALICSALEAVISPIGSVVEEPLSIWLIFPQCARRGI